MMWSSGTPESWLTLIALFLIALMFPVFALGKRWGQDEGFEEGFMEGWLNRDQSFKKMLKEIQDEHDILWPPSTDRD